MENKKEGKKVSASFATGVIALVFLAVGYQTALFIHRAAVVEISANRDTPDTVFLYGQPEPASGPPASSGRVERRSGKHTDASVAVRRNTSSGRQHECFSFNPNTVSVQDLMRLGFSEKQARSIDNYRQKGGRFRRKEDFAKSYVVADSVYQRLEPYIDIPKLDINKADSAAFDGLPGIGPWFAAKMVSYRAELGGYSYPEQLMDIYRFDKEKFDALEDLVTAGPSEPYRLWTLPEDSLRTHPYIGSRAHGVVLFRERHRPEELSVRALEKAGVLSPEMASKLSRCRIAPAVGK